MDTRLPSRIEYGPDKGKYPAYAWPGGYTLLYWDVCGNYLCADCASLPSELGSEVVGCETYDEGPVLYCDNCNAEIESSYGDPYEDEEEEEDTEFWYHHDTQMSDM